MPLLLLLPFALLALVALWLVLLPVSLWARYSSGRARRRAQGWVVRGNAWLLAMTLPIFLLSSWFATHWMDDALRDAGLGLLVGALAPDHGCIRVDGADLADWQQERLAAHIGYLPQNPTLFPASVRENIASAWKKVAKKLDPETAW